MEVAIAMKMPRLCSRSDTIEKATNIIAATEEELSDEERAGLSIAGIPAYGGTAKHSVSAPRKNGQCLTLACEELREGVGCEPRCEAKNATR